MKLDGPYTLWPNVANAVSGGAWSGAVLTRCRFASAILVELWDASTGGTVGYVSTLDIEASGPTGTYGMNNGALFGWSCDRSPLLNQNLRNGAGLIIAPIVAGSLFVFGNLRLTPYKNATADTVTLNGRAWYARDPALAVASESGSP